jgi:Family of unknown function (DUF6982)
MSVGHKKVILRKRNRDWLAGYLPPVEFVEEGKITLLDPAGKVTTLELQEVKWICFVRDFQSGESSDPERLLRRSFASRPRNEGLWLRMQLLDDDVTLEGLAVNNLSFLDPYGVFITPPDTRSNTQRIFLPRSSLATLEIVAVIGVASRRKTSPETAQADLFENS